MDALPTHFMFLAWVEIFFKLRAPCSWNASGSALP